MNARLIFIIIACLACVYSKIFSIEKSKNNYLKIKSLYQLDSMSELDLANKEHPLIEETNRASNGEAILSSITLNPIVDVKLILLGKLNFQNYSINYNKDHTYNNYNEFNSYDQCIISFLVDNYNNIPNIIKSSGADKDLLKLFDIMFLLPAYIYERMGFTELSAENYRKYLALIKLLSEKIPLYTDKGFQDRMFISRFKLNFIKLHNTSLMKRYYDISYFSKKIEDFLIYPLNHNDEFNEYEKQRYIQIPEYYTAGVPETKMNMHDHYFEETFNTFCNDDTLIFNDFKYYEYISFLSRHKLIYNQAIHLTESKNDFIKYSSRFLIAKNIIDVQFGRKRRINEFVPECTTISCIFDKEFTEIFFSDSQLINMAELILKYFDSSSLGEGEFLRDDALIERLKMINFDQLNKKFHEIKESFEKLDYKYDGYNFYKDFYNEIH